MPSSFTSNLRLTLPATGENNGTWGSLVNNGITSLIDNAVAGTASVAMSDANYTLTSANGTTDEARYMFITLTGSLTATRNVVCPSTSKLYFVYNNTSGGRSIVFKTSAGSGITIANGRRAALYCDGTNVVYANDQAVFRPALTVSGAMTGTGTDYGIDLTGVTVNSTVNTLATTVSSSPSTQAASFTLATLEGFRASLGTVGAGSTVTTHRGFHATSSIVGAQNNFGFFSAIPSQTNVSISSISGNGATVTVDTAASHNLTTGDLVLVANVPDTTMTSGTYNGGPYTITVIDSNTFTYASTATSSAAITSAGTMLRANRWNFYADGTGQNYFGGNTLVNVNNAFPALRVIQNGSGDVLYVQDTSDPDSSPFVIDNAGRVINGYSSAITSIGGVIGYYQQQGTTQNATTVAVGSWATADANQGQIHFTKSGSGSVGVHTAVVDAENLGRVSFAGSDGTNFIEAARIAAVVAGTPGTNDMPGALALSTTPDGTAAPVERVRVKPAGQVRFVPLTADPAGAEAGDVYYNSSTNKLRVYNGTAWVDLH